jgi:hypothetical protein
MAAEHWKNGVSDCRNPQVTPHTQQLFPPAPLPILKQAKDRSFGGC